MANPKFEALAGPLDIDFVRGDDLDIPLEWTTGEIDTIDEVPLPVDDHTFRAQVRKTPNDPKVLAELDVDDTLAADGIIRLSCPAATTAKFPPTNLVWDLEVVVGGKKRTYLAGACKITGDVTK